MSRGKKIGSLGEIMKAHLASVEGGKELLDGAETLRNERRKAAIEKEQQRENLKRERERKERERRELQKAKREFYERYRKKVEEATRIAEEAWAKTKRPHEERKQKKQLQHPKKISEVKPPSLSENSRYLLSLGEFHEPDRSGLTSREQSNQTQRYSNSEFMPELYMGIDFGSTHTKVIIRESGSKRAYAVPFSNDDENPFLISSQLYTVGNAYTLFSRDQSLLQTDLKRKLVQTPKFDSAELNHAIAFIALIIRTSRAWFLEHHADEFPNCEFEWVYHLGLPARDFSNIDLVSKYEYLGKCALNLANSESQILTQSDLINAKNQLKKGLPEEHIEIFPEVAAQLHGYVRSDRWDHRRNRLMLVDIGGSTIDSTLVNAQESSDGTINYSFLTTDVLSKGTLRLETDRLNLLRNSANIEQHPEILDSLNLRLEKLASIAKTPSSIDGYISELRWKSDTLGPDITFYNEYANFLWDRIIAPAKTTLDRRPEAYQNLLLFLCGGGSSVDLFKLFVTKINTSSSSVSFQLVEERTPAQLKNPKINDAIYGRLSVAFGLAHDDLGSWVSPDQIPPLPPLSNADRTYQDSVFVDKDMT